MRVCCLVLAGALELVSDSALAQEAVALVADDLERAGAFQLVAEVADSAAEDVQIFAPLSPLTVEAEPVKLPKDQTLEP